MIDFLKEWVLNLASLGIFLVLIDILAPSGKSKKVINMVSGFILVLAIIQPFLNWIFSNVNFSELYDQNNEYIEAIMGETEKSIADTQGNFSAAELKEKQNKQIIIIYSQKLADRIRKIVMEVENFQRVDVDLIINEDYNSWNYGEIKKIYINAYMYKAEEENKGGRSNINISIEKIEEVKIDSVNIGDGLNNDDTYSGNDNHSNNSSSKGKSINQTSYANYENAMMKSMEDLIRTEELTEKIKDKVSSAMGVLKKNIVVYIIQG
ncbi:MAG TPA: stage III sporulation protein AF [Clostridiaceae bacterium]|nr:stage III sporulation protein AF [Clostridiaceae bacterium]